MRRIGRESSGALPRALVGALAALVISVVPAAAQGFTLVGGIGYQQGSPGPSLVDAFSEAGLDDEKPRSCLSTRCVGIPHPFYFDEGIDISVLVGARYELDLPLSVEAVLSNGPRGHAEGYNRDDRLGLVLAYASWHLTSTLGVHLGPLLLQAGPVFNSTGWSATRNSARKTTGRTLSVGGTAALSAAVRVQDVEVSLRAGVRDFPAANLREAVQLQMEPAYETIFIGVTATRAGRN